MALQAFFGAVVEGIAIYLFAVRCGIGNIGPADGIFVQLSSGRHGVARRRSCRVLPLLRRPLECQQALQNGSENAPRGDHHHYCKNQFYKGTDHKGKQ